MSTPDDNNGHFTSVLHDYLPTYSPTPRNHRSPLLHYFLISSLVIPCSEWSSNAPVIACQSALFAYHNLPSTWSLSCTTSPCMRLLSPSLNQSPSQPAQPAQTLSRSCQFTTPQPGSQSPTSRKNKSLSRLGPSSTARNIRDGYNPIYELPYPSPTTRAGVQHTSELTGIPATISAPASSAISSTIPTTAPTSIPAHGSLSVARKPFPYVTQQHLQPSARESPAAGVEVAHVRTCGAPTD